MVKFCDATINDINEVVKMAMILYNTNDEVRIYNEILKIINLDVNILLVVIDQENYIGFGHGSIRREYVEGCGDYEQVAYLEGIYVREDYRYQGIGKNIVIEMERRFRDQGIEILASDCELSNICSKSFHQAIGFQEVNRNIHFIKKIK